VSWTEDDDAGMVETVDGIRGVALQATSNEKTLVWQMPHCIFVGLELRPLGNSDFRHPTTKKMSHLLHHLSEVSDPLNID
jgi:hypothetical protein